MTLKRILAGIALASAMASALVTTPLAAQTAGGGAAAGTAGTLNISVLGTDPILVSKSAGKFTVSLKPCADGQTIAYSQAASKWICAAPQGPLDVLTTTQPTPTATGNTTNLNTSFKDSNGDTWIVDSLGDAVKAGSSACLTSRKKETFTATAGQTTFTIAKTPVGDVEFNRNGIYLAAGSATSSGTTVTYDPSANNTDPLVAGDRVDIDYIWSDCASSGSGGGGSTGTDTTAAVKSSDGTITVTSSVAGNVTTYDLSYKNSGTAAAGGQSFSANTVGMADQSVANGPTFPNTVIKLANTTANTFVNGTTYNAATGTLTIGETANYLVTFSVRFGPNIPVTAGLTYLSGLLINGVLTYTNTQLIEVTSASRNTVQIQPVTIPITLTAGTTVQLVASQNESSAKPVYASRGTYITIARLSGV